MGEATRIEPGAVIAGKYRVDHVLAEGGMGYVLAATHLALKERVALKLLLPAVSAQPALADRFLREAQAAACLRSEHVGRVTDIGTLDDGAPYMVMEYLDGADLAALLAARGCLPVGEAADLLLPVCEALAEAHARGIVHRDLKPGNIFVARRPDGSRLVKVVDFGISKLAAPGPELTGSMAAMGTPAYMAPEQMRSARDVDGRADVWSLGVTLYECVLGCRPFQADSLPGLCLAITHDPPAPLPTWLPAPVIEVVRRCLEKEPQHRFLTMGEVAAALAPLANDALAAAAILARARALSRGVATLEPGRAPQAPPAPTTLGGSAAAVAAGPGGPSRARARRLAAMVGGLLVVGGVVAGVISSRAGEGSPRAAGRAVPRSAATTAPSASSSGTELVPGPPPASSPPGHVAGASPSTAPTIAASASLAKGDVPQSQPHVRPRSIPKSAPAPSPAAQEASSLDTPPSPPPPAGDLPAQLVVRLYSTPAGATVTRLDGTRVGFTPLELHVTRTADALRYRLSLPRHVPETIAVDLVGTAALVERVVVLHPDSTGLASSAPAVPVTP